MSNLKSLIAINLFFNMMSHLQQSTVYTQLHTMYELYI